MNKVYHPRFQETYYCETLDNGLKVVLWEKKDFSKSFFMMATPMGSLDVKQCDSKGNVCTFPAGIAHFLEHKMFEDDQKDVMDKFAEMGANVNAFTSYNETVYYFSTSNDVMKPLELLLDFVQKLSITEASVEKEKGIIIQELEMYQQMSEIRIINETLDCLFYKHPMKYDIGGDKDSVNATSREDLYNCYELNYHPSKMVLIGVCAEDPQKLISLIKQNQNKKHFPLKQSFHRMHYDEPYEVKKKSQHLMMNVSKTKVSYALKCKGIKDPILRNRKEWGFKILFDLYFSSLNPQYQEWLNKGLVNHSFGFDIDFGEDYGYLMFYSESDKPEQFKDLIVSVIKSISDIDEIKFENLKHRYFGMCINQLNDHKQIAISYIRNLFGGIDFYEAIEVIESITKEEVLALIQELDFDNTCSVFIEPIH